MLEVLSKPIFLKNQSMVTTPSIGVLVCDPKKLSFNEILQRSDIAMYYAKNMGKNRAHFFDEKDHEKVKFEGELESELSKALKDKTLEVYYQTQVNSQGEVIGVEALARWNIPKFGYISPDKFIPIAEKNNLISEIWKQIFARSCEQLAKWKLNPQLKSLKTLSINISSAQIFTDEFYYTLLNIVRKNGVSHKNICLEITETIFMENFELSFFSLERLRRNRFKISLDDFGTGYSSLSYLLKLPIDEVKIDRSFVSNMKESQESLTMIEGIVNLCKQMNLEVVAEGVENEEQLALLKKFVCDVYQGYYLGRPVTAKEVDFKI